MSITKSMRFEVFERDNYKCRYCGATPEDCILEVDHIEAKSNGGKDLMENLATACFDCNRGKAAKDLEDKSRLENKERRRAQEMREDQRKAKLFCRNESDKEDTEAEIKKILLEMSKDEEVSKSHIRGFLNIVDEFDKEKAMEWLKTSAANLDKRNKLDSESMMRYFYTIVSNERDSSEVQYSKANK